MRSVNRAQGFACTAVLLLAVSGAGKPDRKAANNKSIQCKGCPCQQCLDMVAEVSSSRWYLLEPQTYSLITCGCMSFEPRPPWQSEA